MSNSPPRALSNGRSSQCLSQFLRNRELASGAQPGKALAPPGRLFHSQFHGGLWHLPAQVASSSRAPGQALAWHCPAPWPVKIHSAHTFLEVSRAGANLPSLQRGGTELRRTYFPGGAGGPFLIFTSNDWCICYLLTSQKDPHHFPIKAQVQSFNERQRRGSNQQRERGKKTSSPQGI